MVEKHFVLNRRVSQLVETTSSRSTRRRTGFRFGIIHVSDQFYATLMVPVVFLVLAAKMTS